MRLKFQNITSGIQTDVDPYDLPASPQAFVWSNGDNVRFLDDYIQKIEGESSVGTATVAPYWMLPVSTASTYYWLLAGLQKVYVTSDFATFTNITRQTAAVDVNYTGSADNIWNGGIISGIPVINNGIDDPQMWNPVSASIKLSSLTWDASNTWSAKGYTAKIIRPFREYLVALDTNESSTRYPYRLRWSTSTLSGVPATWDDTDATEDAGYTEINQSQGFLIDCLTLRENNIIYKEDETWVMSEVGGDNIFRFDPLFTQSGILAPRCVQPFLGQHIVLTTGDLIVHNGSSIESIIEKRMKKWIFNNIDSTNYGRSFMVPNYRKKEMWICFPSTGATEPDTALIWNYHDNTFSARDLSSNPYIAYGVIDPSENLTWDADSQVWDADSQVWDYRSYNPTTKGILLASSTSLLQGDSTNQFNGTNYTAYVERTGIDLGEPERFKTINRVYIRATSSSGIITVKIGSQEFKNGPIGWTTKTFDPSSQEYIDCLATGRYMGIRFESTTNSSWKIHSFDLEYELSGYF